MENIENGNADIMSDVISSVKNIVLTLSICCILYPGLIWIIGRSFVPDKAEGSLIHNSSGIVIGSHFIGQKFIQPKYFWSRPSAVDYNASASGGSNLATTNLALRNRIQHSISALEGQKPVPLDLVTASGSGLDPNITATGAYYQAERVASARRVNVEKVNELILQSASKESLGRPALVNVLELNLLLDRTIQSKD